MKTHDEIMVEEMGTEYHSLSAAQLSLVMNCMDAHARQMAVRHASNVITEAFGISTEPSEKAYRKYDQWARKVAQKTGQY